MNRTYHHFAACLFSVVLSVSHAAPAEWQEDLRPLNGADWNAARAAHLLERAGFGGAPAEVAALAAMTPQQLVSLSALLQMPVRDIERRLADSTTNFTYLRRQVAPDDGYIGAWAVPIKPG